MKQKKGISLIVLVITIIIMIIISGAIIITLTETNIIDRAETAVNKYNETELKQRVGLVFTEAQMAEYTDLEYSIEDNLKNIFEGIYGKDNITVIKSGKNYKVNVKDSKTTFRIKPDGSVQQYEEMDPTNVYARLDDEGVLYLRATKIDDRYNEYINSSSIQVNWNTAGNATPASVVKVIVEEKISPTTTNEMFAHMSNFVQIENIQNLHTENVTNMNAMFDGCYNLTTIDLEMFNTEKVKDMSSMFYNCKGLIKLDLNSFDTSSCESMKCMFYSCQNLNEIEISSFNTCKVKSFSKMFESCYNLEELNVNHFDTGNATEFSAMFNQCRKLSNINVSSFDISNAKDISAMFANCRLLKNINISNFNTTNVTNMKAMFESSIALSSIIFGKVFVINEGVNLQYILNNVLTDIKITATEATRDKLISASGLTEDNFEIIN